MLYDKSIKNLKSKLFCWTPCKYNINIESNNEFRKIMVVVSDGIQNFKNRFFFEL